MDRQDTNEISEDGNESNRQPSMPSATIQQPNEVLDMLNIKAIAPELGQPVDDPSTEMYISTSDPDTLPETMKTVQEDIDKEYKQQIEELKGKLSALNNTNIQLSKENKNSFNMLKAKEEEIEMLKMELSEAEIKLQNVEESEKQLVNLKPERKIGDKDRQHLQNCHEMFMNSLKPDEVITKMHTYGALSSQELDNLKSCMTDAEKNGALYKIIRSSSRKHYDAYGKALEETGQLPFELGYLENDAFRNTASEEKNEGHNELGIHSILSNVKKLQEMSSLIIGDIGNIIKEVKDICALAEQVHSKCTTRCTRQENGNNTSAKYFYHCQICDIDCHGENNPLYTQDPEDCSCLLDNGTCITCYKHCSRKYHEFRKCPPPKTIIGFSEDKQIMRPKMEEVYQCDKQQLLTKLKDLSKIWKDLPMPELIKKGKELFPYLQKSVPRQTEERDTQSY